MKSENPHTNHKLCHCDVPVQTENSCDNSNIKEVPVNIEKIDADNLLKKPVPEDFGFHHRQGFDDHESGWMLEGGEEAYCKAFFKWELTMIHVQQAAPELLKAIVAIVYNIEQWLETGIPADPNASKKLYDDAKEAIKKAVALVPDAKFRVRFFPEDTDETFDGTVVEEHPKFYVVVPDQHLLMRQNWDKRRCEIIS